MATREEQTTRRKENVAIDLGKMFATLFIVMIHCSPIKGMTPLVLRGGIWRLGVPFFFITSGLFLSEKEWKGDLIKSYLTRLIRVYLIWCVIYAPLYMPAWLEDDRNVLLKTILFFRQFFMGNLWGVLWFFPALIAAVLLFVLLYRKLHLSDRQLLCVSIFAYTLGVMGNMWQPAVSGLPVIGKLIDGMVLLFGHTRNGLFEGLPCIVFGYLLYRRQDSFQISQYMTMLSVGLLMLILEPTVIDKIWGTGSLDIGFGVMMSSVSLVAILNYLGKTWSFGEKFGIMARKLSLLILLIHPWVIDGILVKYEESSLWCFMAVIGISMVLATAVLFFEGKHKWLIYLH